jgi:hypothetical protein
MTLLKSHGRSLRSNFLAVLSWSRCLASTGLEFDMAAQLLPPLPPLPPVPSKNYQKELWIAVATAVARAEGSRDANVPAVWANKTLDAFNARFGV